MLTTSLGGAIFFYCTVLVVWLVGRNVGKLLQMSNEVRLLLEDNWLSVGVGTLLLVCLFSLQIGRVYLRRRTAMPADGWHRAPSPSWPTSKTMSLRMRRGLQTMEVA